MPEARYVLDPVPGPLGTIALGRQASSRRPLLDRRNAWRCVAMPMWLVCLASPGSIEAAELKSPQGFVIQYPDGWESLPRQQMDRIGAKDAAATFVELDQLEFPARITVKVVEQPVDVTRVDDSFVAHYLASVSRGGRRPRKLKTELRTIAGRQSLCIAAKQELPGGDEPARLWCVAIPAAQATYCVSCFALESQWARVFPVFQKALDTLVIDAPAPRVRAVAVHADDAPGKSAAANPVARADGARPGGTSRPPRPAAQAGGPLGFALKIPDGWASFSREKFTRTGARLAATVIVEPGQREFAPNIVVVVVPQTLDVANRKEVEDYVTGLIAQMSAGGQRPVKIKSEERLVAERPALSLAFQQEVPLRVGLARIWNVAVPGAHSTYTVTCTCMESQWARVYPIFKAALDSLAVDLPVDPAANKLAIPLDPKQVEEQVMKVLIAGQQFDAEKLIEGHLDRSAELSTFVLLNHQHRTAAAKALLQPHADVYRENQHLLFLYAASVRSQFEVERAGPVFEMVVQIDPLTVAGRCAAEMLILDGSQKDPNAIAMGFTALNQLADANPDDLIVRWMLAVECRNHNHNEEGIEHYKKILAKWDPGPVLVHQTYANLLDEVHRYEEALVERHKAVAMYPAGWSYDGLANTLRSLGRLKESDEAHARALELNPGDSLHLSNAAGTLIDQGKYDEAIAKCREAIQNDPRELHAWLKKGVAYFHLGHWDTAIADLSEAIRLGSKAVGVYNQRGLDAAYYNRGLAYVKRHDWDMAIADFSEALRLDPKYSAALAERADVYLAKHDLDKALADAEQNVQLDPKNAYAYNTRGMVYDAKGDPARALEDYNAALRLKPDCAAAHANSGNVYLHQRNLEKALAELNEAIRLDPRNSMEYCDRAAIYVTKGDADRAIADSNEAIRLNADEALAYANRAGAYSIKGDYGKAAADLDEAIRLQPDNGNMYRNRGVIHRKMGESAKADADFARARSLGAIP